MTERENLQHVLQHTGKSEWVPVPPHCCLTVLPSVVRDRPAMGTDGFDWFGCHWTWDAATNGFVQTPTSVFPVTDITRWREQVVFPDLDALDWEGAAKRNLANYNREDKMLRIFTESGPFERLHHLLGFEEAFVQMSMEPESFSEFINALADFKIRMVEKIATYYKPDLYVTMDDLGSARSPLLSLGMYRELIKPADARVIRAIHDNGMYVVYHSCGRMQSFIGDLIEMGADVFHPLQGGGVNDQEAVQEQYGDRAVFMCCLDNMVNIPEKTEAELRNEVRRIIDLFSEKQNLIFGSTCVLPKNNAILLDEAEKYGKRWHF